MAKLNTKIVMLEGEQGKDGTNIKSVEKSASDGLTDTYTITLTDGSKSSFNVTNGKGISSIKKTSTSGLVDTYTITYNDGTTQNYTVNNGKDADLIQSQIVPTASIESGATASKAYNVGDFLVKNGILYKVTKAIVKDDVLTVGTNIELDTVASELSEIKSGLAQYKVKEYTFEYHQTGKTVIYDVDEPNAFIDGSSYLDDGGFRLPIDANNNMVCSLAYKDGGKIKFYSGSFIGTAHVFVRYK